MHTSRTTCTWRSPRGGRTRHACKAEQDSLWHACGAGTLGAPVYERAAGPWVSPGEGQRLLLLPSRSGYPMLCAWRRHHLHRLRS
eukprot:1533655-Alexandrium_andersonii.AAC.1